MDSEYDRKFEEMKKYIPFLENMITRLESTSTSSSNPRQAQLDKIRSLRDLLSNKKKRMKMENLLKCEQVLVNLYAKVEQRDTLSGVSGDKNTTDSVFSIDTPTQKEKSDLEAVRNKLKTVVKRQETKQDTLPEILGRSEVSDVHTSGTKEPALFQRRPNQQDSGINDSGEKISPPGSASKRHYTRVLVSPESSSRRWSSSESSEKPLFSRRSPRRSPRKFSPSYYKRERRKSKESINKQSRKQKDLNITLNVPEESLSSLNTKDILSRILNCSDSDVDIDTLRELRKQILGELKKTGAKDDISDLILKSYNKKKNKPKDKEVEEGELSDSESEAIESIYGSLVFKESGHAKTSSNKDTQPRKIQICLVINSDDKTESKVNELPKQDINADFAELEMYDREKKSSLITEQTEVIVRVEDDKKANIISDSTNRTPSIEDSKGDSFLESQNMLKENVVTTCDNNVLEVKDNPAMEVQVTTQIKPKTLSSKPNDVVTTSEAVISSSEETVPASSESTQFKANFYKPMTERNISELTDILQNTANPLSNTESSVTSGIEIAAKSIEKSTEIPLLHDRTIDNKPSESTLSEIDILQALKNEILSEITVPGTEATAPPLHQPKLIKVASASELLPKKRISIEKYKEKSVTSSKSNSDKVSPKDDQMKKTSLKLTDKECERFFSVPKISFDEEDESFDEDDKDIDLTDIYSDLAPKSPDHDDSNFASVPPVIIPVDPIKPIPVNYKADVDMRTLPILSPNKSNVSSAYNNISIKNVSLDLKKPGNKIDQINSRPSLDPRVRDLTSNVSHLSPNPYAANSDIMSRHNVYPVSSSSTPHRIMTPNARTYEMTSGHQSFDTDQSNQKHVYVPTLSYYDHQESENVTKDVRSWDDTKTIVDRSRLDDAPDNYWNPQRENISHHPRFGDSINSDKFSKGLHSDIYSLDNREHFRNSDVTVTSTQPSVRLEASMTPTHSFVHSDCSNKTSHNYARLECPPTPTHMLGRLECPPTPNHPFGRTDCPPTPSHPFGRTDCPPTPSHPFGRTDCPPTPSHPFGRTDCPPTPSHPFGRTDCPPTPSHPFGRTDCPPTPSHPFGRTDCPPTPSHPFGRTDCPPTPSHPFGRTDCPPTPSHPFSRADCPQTPSHPFGRTEGSTLMVPKLIECSTPSNPYAGADSSPLSTPAFGRNECHPTPSRMFSTSDCALSPNSPYVYHETTQKPNHNFGGSTNNQYSRTDFNIQKNIKDPRLNRKTESELKPQFDERDRGYKKRDHGRESSYSTTQKLYSGSDTYRNYDREQSVGRNKYKYYSHEYRGRQYIKDQKCERSTGRLLSKDSDNDKFGKSDYHYKNDMRYSEELRSKREYYREKSVGGSSSVGRKKSNEGDCHKLSVASTSGRSFTIDTSITATFQKIIDSAKEIQGFVSSFDARRQRAASVGRSLARESSVGKTLISNKMNKHEDKRDAFRRASSVGREFSDNTDKRSFQEIKADFKTYKFSARPSNDHKSTEHSKTYGARTEYHTRQSRKEIYEKEKDERQALESKKSSYSPRRNYRDPRMRKQFDKKYDKHSPDAYGHRSGIVYSNDNIVTGSILASGYGVKNYKIPKIKRITNEKEADVNTDSIRKTDEKLKDELKKDNKTLEKDLNSVKTVDKVMKNKAIAKDNTNDIQLSDIDNDENKKSNVGIDEAEEQNDKRQTRSSKKNMSDSKAVKKPKKHRKVIYESESDVDMETEDTKDILQEDKPISELKTEECISSVGQKICTQIDSNDLNSSFGIDELGIFTDNVVSDPIVDNINSLIADLDKDLNTSKPDLSHNFTKEISVENMMENISSPERDNKILCSEDSVKMLEPIGEIPNDQKNPIGTGKVIVDKDVSLNDATVSQNLSDVPSELGILVSDKDHDCLKDSFKTIQSDNEPNEESENLNNITSTTLGKCNNDAIDSTSEVENNTKLIDDKSKLCNQNTQSCSTPDSTINTDDVIITLNDEENTFANAQEVTSTGTTEMKPNLSATEAAPVLDSIGSLLSILQDKSKIKELLSMLGEKSNEHEKIKKKLEKLSEIVSDDDEPNKELAEDSKFELHPDTDNGENVNNKESDKQNIESVNDGRLSKVYTDSSIELDNSEREMPKADAEITEKETKSQQIKKTKSIKKIKRKSKKGTPKTEKRVTRSNAPSIQQKVKKPPRELMQLQEDIKEMFIRDDVLSATGIRMCRLAKLVDASTSNTKDDLGLPDTEPVVILENYKTTKARDSEKVKKKKIPSIKIKAMDDISCDVGKKDNIPTATNYKAGPKSKTKNKRESDPYAFESDSIGDANTEKASNDGSSNGSDSECDSLTSYVSFESTEIDVKKKTKRKRRGWQAGVIKPKTKKKKVDLKHPVAKTVSIPTDKLPVTDLNCFTDRNYCFQKNQLRYSCRFCSYIGDDIVLHYRNLHPHIEVPLSRMAPDVAIEAIEMCEEINFQAICKISSDKYVCIFCFKEFPNCKSVLEALFWHIVSRHTGEFKQNCFQCDNESDCPFKLHIPPPPEDAKRQLIGYMCKKCNFTQISLENLKTHVIMRHDDNQTAVYTINLSVMSKKALKSLVRRSEAKLMSQNRIQSSNRVECKSNEKENDVIDEDSESEGVRTRKSTRKPANLSITPTIQSKITFEADDNISELSDLVSETSEINIKTERDDIENVDGISEEGPNLDFSEFDRSPNLKQANYVNPLPSNDVPVQSSETSEAQPCNDILNFPHFKINQTESGGKEYFCCINGNYHFKTSLLISMKKHVQFKHAENWDGYCYVCQVIVTPQGVHKFRDCLEHYLDKHIDNFPIFEKECVEPEPIQSCSMDNEAPIEKPKITVRPLSELTAEAKGSLESSTMPVIQSIISLGASQIEPKLNPTHSLTGQEIEQKMFKYEEHQAEVMAKKYYLVVQAMMSPDNLVKIFKCSGRYCSYATNCTREALAHATTHQRIGGSDSLHCTYCDFDSAGNAVDLVMHVFKMHGGSLYCCEKCFYRAASSQAVAAHISRKHGILPVPGSVLRTTAVSSIPILKCSILTREEAVPYYICGHGDGDTSCKFRTYTPDKFCEHLEQRHADATAHPCHLCTIKTPQAAEMVQHMKVHGIMLYQCTWCVHGAESERSLLDHVSILHPDKPPQAYIRIMTNKEGSTEKRVLPLAFLNKHKVPTKDLTPTATKEDPEREAKRSIEMEALIAPFVTDSNETPVDSVDTHTIHTAEMPEVISETLVNENTVNSEPPELSTSLLEPEDSKVSIVKQLPEVSLNTSNVPIQTPISIDSPQTNESATVKIENTDMQKGTFFDILVLDSDEESSATNVQPVIDVSDEENSTITTDKQTPILVPVKNLYKCPHCRQLYKNIGGLKKHMHSCIIKTSDIQCPHCTATADDVDSLMSHYSAFHSSNKRFQCEICDKTFVAENNAKRHLKLFHKVFNTVITKSEKDGLPCFLVNGQQKPPEEPKERNAPKRKLSGPKSDTIPFKRRFEPQEIDQLPINPILDQLVYCSRCEFSTKVRLNMVRHLQLHAEQQPVPQTVPVNPVPHLESNEKHFDKMVNLASSSVVKKTSDKTRPDLAQSVTMLIPPESASRYPKYVPERQRHTCGAKGCSYISVDEAMLRRHWDTLHSGTNDFHCVHCPPHQHLDTSKPLTAVRIVSHLKMHDSTLYACSLCSYYHFKKEALEKHLSEIHKDGRLMIVREEGVPAEVAPTAQTSSTPTMDLKPWQCGLCKYKSMLHPEVVDHCSKVHQSKMQFKCTYCPFRTSTIENVSKHQTNSHAEKPKEVFYYFYREGSIPDEPDGTPRWMIQRQKAGPSEPEIKFESSVPDDPVPMTSTPGIPPINIDLNLVKREVGEAVTTTVQKTMEDLCKIYGMFCEPNGIRYKCPLCKVVIEDTQQGMQSHLYEELNYRKWSCGLCSYKAFHKMGLTDHMTSEHRRQYDVIELPIDANIEIWVKGVLDHQAAIIDQRRASLMKHKIIIPPKPGSSTEVVAPKEMEIPQEIVSTYSDEVLERAFGPFGHCKESMFCCSRCGFLNKDAGVIRDHLEAELNKIRWNCSNCDATFQTYHEARFHTKGHDGPSSPIEALRDPVMRAAWVTAAIQRQKNEIQTSTPSSSIASTPEKMVPYTDSDNSLLAVRYEKSVIPDELNTTRKRPALDSDDEKLIIDERNVKRRAEKNCPYCSFSTNTVHNLRSHMLSHFNLKQYNCGHCGIAGWTKGNIVKHSQLAHGSLPVLANRTELPPQAQKLLVEVATNQTGSVRQKSTMNTNEHNVNTTRNQTEVLKCVICSNICMDIKAMQGHFNSCHLSAAVDYTLLKTRIDGKCYECSYCSNRFADLETSKRHHIAVHAGSPYKIKLNSLSELYSEIPSSSRTCARKSTTKLPNSVAKKSTTKLPYSVPDDSDEEYSYYGTKPPSLEEFSNVTTLMSFCNRLTPFTMKQFSEHLNIEPLVIVTDIKNSSD